MPLPSSSAVPAVAALALVLGLILLAARLLRGTRLVVGRAGPRRLAIRDSLALDRVRRLHLVSCDGRELLLLTGGGGDVAVGWLPARETGA